MAKSRVRLNRIARLWVNALRSGKYKQTTNSLTTINRITGEITGHCCMGVLCELAVKLKVISAPQVFINDLKYDGDNAVLPDSVREWAGLKTDTGAFARGGKSLTSENDSGKSFKQIARIIEQKAKELFV